MLKQSFQLILTILAQLEYNSFSDLDLAVQQSLSEPIKDVND